AGKSTTMRLILGLEAPTSGSALIDGRSYRQLPNAALRVGALLDAGAVHGGRSARDHLLCLAQSAGISRRRVGEVLDMVGLASAAGRNCGEFSLGMGQRLGIAAALLGDPEVLIFDEPVNGLDPEGIHWVRTLMRQLAQQGCTVFVSSHLMSEMAITAEHLIVIGHGRLLADMSLRQFIDRHSTSFARIRTPDGAGPGREAFARVLADAGARTEPARDGALKVTGMSLPQINHLAHHHGLVLHELSPHHASLEEAYMRLTHDAVEYRAGSTTPPEQLPRTAPADDPFHGAPGAQGPDAYRGPVHPDESSV
ncbi:MAG: ATP-binding cassette domain-containing protein, partial [Pseudonocardiaceae bacterium]